MSENVIGVVEELANNGKGKGSYIRVNGLKYGVWDPNEANMDSITEGAAVSFRFKAVEKGGIVYKNIQGKITPTTAAAATTATASTGGSVRRYRNNGEEGGFPIHQRAYERALDRRNATQVAVAALGVGFSAEDIIEFARKIEAYTTGEELTEADAILEFRDKLDS